ncbi:MAG: SdrD B-like domain-containing protein, partial [Tepidisphaeraceae bacterium]
LAVACMRIGAHDGRFAGDATIRLVSDSTPDQTQPIGGGELGAPIVTPGALLSQTGTIFGVAQPTGSNYLYSSTFTKRHADWGPGGVGAIYRTDAAQATAGTPNASVFFDVNSLAGRPAGDFLRGADRNGADVRDFENDSVAWDQVGRRGLGNLSTTDDGSELYTVGLATGELIRVPIPADGSRPASAQAYAIPRDACAVPGDARPFATAVHDGLVYVAGTCSEESRGDPPPRTASANLRLFAYTFDPATGAFSGPVLNQTLEAERLCIIRSGTATTSWPSTDCGSTLQADWHPWATQSTIDAIDPGRAGRYSQPMLADISFVGDDMVFAIRDRSSDQLGTQSMFPDGTPGEVGMQAGYTLRACVSGGTSYQLESNGTCGGLTASGPKNVPEWGPGGSLFYWDQNYNSFRGAGAAHDYGGQGGTLQIPGYPELRLASGYGANRCAPGNDGVNGCPNTDGPSASAGVLYASNTDGSRVRGFNLYTYSRADLSVFGKANGLGDLEALCQAAPIEIGNYVWLDPDKNGVQDPDEAPIADVAVELLDAGGAVIATTRTDANGQYYFNETNVPGGVLPDTDYTVRIPLGQAPLADHSPTNPDTDAQLRDSDGIPSGAYVIDRLRTGAAGHNDHTHDFGFNPPFNVSIRKAVSSPEVKVGDPVTYTLTARNDGPGTADDVVVTDNLPEQLALTGARTSLGSCTTSGNSVRCELGQLAPGQTETVTVTARALRSGTAINNARISSPGDRDPRDNEDRREVRIPTPDVSIRKSVSAPTVKLGESVTFTLLARNNGPGLAQEVVVTDAMPQQLVVTGVSTPVGRCATTGNSVRCELGTLTEGQEIPITVTARAVRSGRAVNDARIGAREDSNPRNNEDRREVEIPTPDVSITKTVSARTVRLGGSVTYSLLARNNGPGIAEEVVVTDALPSRLRLTGARSAVGTCRTSGNRLSCSLGTMAEGATVRITATARAIRTGRAINNAVIGAREDSNPNNNRDRVPVVIRKTDLRLTKVVNRRVLQAGQTATYTIRVTNPTGVPLRNVRTCDDLPSGLAFVRATPRARPSRGQYCWTARVLRAHETRTYRIKVRVLTGTIGRKVNHAVATSPDANTRRAQRAVRVIAGGVAPIAGGVTG